MIGPVEEFVDQFDALSQRNRRRWFDKLNASQRRTAFAALSEHQRSKLFDALDQGRFNLFGGITQVRRRLLFDALDADQRHLLIEALDTEQISLLIDALDPEQRNLMLADMTLDQQDRLTASQRSILGTETQPEESTVSTSGRSAPPGTNQRSGIFISYRREDTGADANALYQSLQTEFGSRHLFKDVDDVPLGANWKDVVRYAIGESAVLLPLIGPAWECSGAIRFELETAFQQDILVIPLLVRGASIETAAEGLEGPVARLADLNCAHLDHVHWKRDLDPVIDAIRGSLSSEAS